MARERRGPSYPVTPEWKQQVIDALRRRGLTRTDLAEMLGVSKTAVTDLLGKLERSRLPPRVEKILWPAADRIREANALIAQRPAERGVVEIAIKPSQGQATSTRTPDTKIRIGLDALTGISELTVLQALMDLATAWCETDDDGRRQLIDLARKLYAEAENRRLSGPA